MIELILIKKSKRYFMPLIRIDVPEGTAREKKEIIHKRVREVVLKTLAPKQVQYDYVSIREAFGIIGDGLPVIDVDLRPGREPERKKGLVDGIAEVLNETMGVKAEDIYCIFRETPAHDHYTGGEPLPEWVPADK
tara:strand:- start:174 stop:578 length:405 start_codon:yes stop_codon:yes gene_type:complete